MDYTFNHEFNDARNCWDIKVAGEIDIFNSNEFKEKLLTLAAEKPRDLRIDCSNLKYMDSTALGALVAVLKNVKLYDGTVFLLNLKPNLTKLFKITNLDKVFIIEGDTND
ncbi:MAG: STAS domain-containing protein [Clostridiales bacterium]|jgi:anti-sigma B factor antagonist|nr:STAS domain-containing protein [Clostridiales bacterium]